MDHFILGSRYYFSRMTDFEKKTYRIIYDAFVDGGYTVEIDIGTDKLVFPSGMTLHQMLEFVIDDNPHLFHLNTQHFRYIQIGSKVTIQTANIYSPEEYLLIYQKLIARVNQIVEQAKKYPSPYEKLKFLHDFLAENITYTKEGTDLKSQREVHTIVGSLLNSACVCDGYARAYRLLCDQLRISCIVAVGEGISQNSKELHAWNFVRLNKKVYHVDVTWDSCFIKGGCVLTDFYFLRSDKVFERDHCWDKSLYHPVNHDYAKDDFIISSKWEFEQHLCSKISNGKNTIRLLFNNTFPGSDVFTRLFSEIMSRNPNVFSGIHISSCLYYDTLKCAEIQLTRIR